MNWDQVEGKWKQYSGRMREKFGRLTDDEIQATKGRRDQLAGLIQEKYGITREEAHRRLDEWMNAEEGTEQSRHGGAF